MSLLYANLKGVSPIGVFTVVLYAQRTLGNSSSHIPFAPLSRVLKSFSKERFVTSTHPFAYGWDGEEWILIASCSQNSLKGVLSNCRPLSKTSTLGIPKWQIMFFLAKPLMFSNSGQRFSFHPFSEIINAHHEELHLSSSYWEWTKDIQSPLSKGSWSHHWSEILRWSSRHIIGICHMLRHNTLH